MSQAAAKRRRTQARSGYAHIHKDARPLYRRRALASISASVEAERRRAAREAARSSKKKH